MTHKATHHTRREEGAGCESVSCVCWILQLCWTHLVECWVHVVLEEQQRRQNHGNHPSQDSNDSPCHPKVVSKPQVAACFAQHGCCMSLDIVIYVCARQLCSIFDFSSQALSKDLVSHQTSLPYCSSTPEQLQRLHERSRWHHLQQQLHLMQHPQRVLSELMRPCKMCTIWGRSWEREWPARCIKQHTRAVVLWWQ